MGAILGSSVNPRTSPGMALIAVCAVSAISGIIGLAVSPTPLNPSSAKWYDRLSKPKGTPPKPIFGAAWPIMYTFAGIAGYRLLRAKPSKARTGALRLWFAETGLIGAWSLLFFGAKDIRSSVLVSISMLAASVVLIKRAVRVDKLSAVLLVPLTAWLAYASFLVSGIWRQNDDRGVPVLPDRSWPNGHIDRARNLEAPRTTSNGDRTCDHEKGDGSRWMRGDRIPLPRN